MDFAGLNISAKDAYDLAASTMQPVEMDRGYKVIQSGDRFLVKSKDGRYSIFTFDDLPFSWQAILRVLPTKRQNLRIAPGTSKS